MLLEIALVFLLWQHKEELMHLFWTRQNKVYTLEEKEVVPRLLKHVIRFCIVVFPLLFTYFIANVNNRRPTPLDGRWEVVEVLGQVGESEFPTHIYFERNRAWMCVFRYPDAWMTHHFEVVNQEKSIEIWDSYRSKGEKIFSGSYELNGNGLALRGDLNNIPLQVTLEKLE